MSTLYVYSLRGRRTHAAGDGTNLRCGAILTGRFLVTTAPPSDRGLCPGCFPASTEGRARAERLAQRATARRRERDSRIVALLITGATDKAVGRHFGWATRTWVRNINDAMHRADARTRFQWGYLVGLADRRNDS